MKLRRKHTNDCVGRSIKHYRLPKNVFASAITFLPCGITEEDQRGNRWLIFVRLKITSENRRDSERTKESRTHTCAICQLRSVGSSEGKRVVFVNIQRTEDRVEPFPITIVRVGQMESRPQWNAFVQIDQPRRCFVGQGFDQRGVHKCKDCSTGANAKGQRHNRCYGKSTVVPELPKSVSEVLKEAFHACASCISLSSSSSATTFPSNKCTSRCACFAKRGSCVTIQIVAPSRCRFCNSSITASPLRESRFPVGSSASRMDGCPASARATATRCG